MFNVGSGEFLVIFLIALIVLGPDKLPDAAKKVGKVMGDLRNLSSGFQQEMRQAMDIDGLKPNSGPTLPPLESESTPPPGDAPTEIAASVPADHDTPAATEPKSSGPGLKSVPNEPETESSADGHQGAA